MLEWISRKGINESFIILYLPKNLRNFQFHWSWIESSKKIILCFEYGLPGRFDIMHSCSPHSYSMANYCWFQVISLTVKWSRKHQEFNSKAWNLASIIYQIVWSCSDQTCISKSSWTAGWLTQLWIFWKEVNWTLQSVIKNMLLHAQIDCFAVSKQIIESPWQFLISLSTLNTKNPQCTIYLYYIGEI